MENTALTSPELGDLKANVYLDKTSGEWVVDIRVFKANTLRGDAYWVPGFFKTYAKEVDARRFASRYA